MPRAARFARAASDLGVFGGGVDVESRMFETEGTLEREQRGIGEIHDERFGCEEEPMELPAGHRFRAVAATLGLGAWAAKTSRKSFSSSLASS